MIVDQETGNSMLPLFVLDSHPMWEDFVACFRRVKVSTKILRANSKSQSTRCCVVR